MVKTAINLVFRRQIATSLTAASLLREALTWITLEVETAILGVGGRLARKGPLIYHLLPFIPATGIRFSNSLCRIIRLIVVTIVHIMAPLPLISGRCGSTVGLVRIVSCPNVLDSTVLCPICFLEDMELLLI